MLLSELKKTYDDYLMLSCIGNYLNYEQREQRKRRNFEPREQIEQRNCEQREQIGQREKMEQTVLREQSGKKYFDII